MKTLLSILLLSGAIYAQDTIQTVKSTNLTTHRVSGYVVQTITAKDTTYQRVEKFTDLPKGVKVNRKDPIKNYPKELLKENEVYMNHLRSNIKGVRYNRN